MAGDPTKRYEEGEAEEILRLAMRQTPSGSIDRERLLSMASELGISEEAVEQAEQELAGTREQQRSKENDAAERKEYRTRRTHDFWNGVWSFLGANSFFFGIWLFAGGGYFWPIWICGFSGIGVVSSGVNTFLNPGAFERDFQRWKRKKAKRAAKIMATGSLDETLDQLAALMPGKGKLMPIKTVRERHGLNLKEAKDAVDEYDSKHGQVFTRG